jgi:hypothetical protein
MKRSIAATIAAASSSVGDELLLLLLLLLLPPPPRGSGGAVFSFVTFLTGEGWVRAVINFVRHGSCVGRGRSSALQDMLCELDQVICLAQRRL